MFIEEIIKDILSNSYKLRESYIKANYLEFYDIVNEYINDNNIEEDVFKIKLWYFINKVKSTYKCTICLNSFTKFINFKEGFRKYCSLKCSQSDIVTKEKRKSTNKEKYGSEFLFSSKYFTENNFGKNGLNSIIKKRKEFSDNYFSENNLSLINRDGFILTIQSHLCSHEFKINLSTLNKRIIGSINPCTSCNPINSGQSGNELNVIEWIKSLNVTVDIKNKEICSPYEIDIYLPDYSLGIEYNGLYWHSELNKDRQYHINKTNILNNKGIDLIHLWEDMWISKRNIIKSIILNRLKLIDRKIYARKCIISHVNNVDKDRFLDDNHIQGKCNSSINIGLYYNQKLVSLMCFLKKYDDYELVRFCSEINTNIIGSSSKLFKYFIQNNKFNSIISFADISIFNGMMYYNLGFTYNYNTEIDYWWVVDGLRRHKSSFKKKNLVKMGYDSNKSESEIMHDLKYYKIWGCGLKKFTYYK